MFKIRARDWSKSITCVFVTWQQRSSRLSALLRITHEKCALLKLSRRKAPRKLYLQVDKANK